MAVSAHTSLVTSKGQQTAYAWYQYGCRSLEDLKNGKGGVKLSSAQRIGIQYYDDINSRMPRNEARDIFELIKPIGNLGRTACAEG